LKPKILKPYIKRSIWQTQNEPFELRNPNPKPQERKVCNSNSKILNQTLKVQFDKIKMNNLNWKTQSQNRKNYEFVIQNPKFWNQTLIAQFDKLKIKHSNWKTLNPKQQINDSKHNLLKQNIQKFNLTNPKFTIWIKNPYPKPQEITIWKIQNTKFYNRASKAQYAHLKMKNLNR